MRVHVSGLPETPRVNANRLLQEIGNGIRKMEIRKWKSSKILGRDAANALDPKNHAMSGFYHAHFREPNSE